MSWGPSSSQRHPSSTGSFSSGGSGDECCPLVVDPLTYIALLTFIAAATYFFQELIAMSSLARKKRSLVLHEGRIYRHQTSLRHKTNHVRHRRRQVTNSIWHYYLMIKSSSMTNWQKNIIRLGVFELGNWGVDPEVGFGVLSSHC